MSLFKFLRVSRILIITLVATIVLSTVAKNSIAQTNPTSTAEATPAAQNKLVIKSWSLIGSSMPVAPPRIQGVQPNSNGSITVHLCNRLSANFDGPGSKAYAIVRSEPQQQEVFSTRVTMNSPCFAPTFDKPGTYDAMYQYDFLSASDKIFSQAVRMVVDYVTE